jgi:hypothetical protein
MIEKLHFRCPGCGFCSGKIIVVPGTGYTQLFENSPKENPTLKI